MSWSCILLLYLCYQLSWLPEIANQQQTNVYTELRNIKEAIRSAADAASTTNMYIVEKYMHHHYFIQAIDVLYYNISTSISVAFSPTPEDEIFSQIYLRKLNSTRKLCHTKEVVGNRYNYTFCDT